MRPAPFAAAMLAGALLVTLPAAPVAADPVVVPVSSEAELLQALGPGCVADTVVTLTSSFTAGVALVNCSVTLQLDGNFLTLTQLALRDMSSATLTVSDPLGLGRIDVIATSAAPTAVQIPYGCRIIFEEGRLHATGHVLGAGIGGDPINDTSGSGVLEVRGGTIIAQGGQRGAGIGGSHTQRGVSLVMSGGHVEATGGLGAAGVGNGESASIQSAIQEIEVSGGTLIATGGDSGAGIGSGANPMGQGLFDLPFITISGGTVDAQGGHSAAGIGGGFDVRGLAVRVDGGTVTATAGEGSLTFGPNAIGAGIPNVAVGMEHGGSLTIAQGASVTVTSDVAPVIGGTYVYDDRMPMILDNDGDLFIGSGFILVEPGSDVEIGPNGRILGTQADPEAGWIYGEGTVVNHGAIRLRFSHVTAFGVVLGNDFTLGYDLAGGSGSAPAQRVYGPTLESIGGALPTAPTRAGYVFDGWRVGGAPFTAATALPGATVPGTVTPVSADTDPTPAGTVAVTATAAWIDVDALLDDGLGANCAPGTTLAVPGDAVLAERFDVDCDVTLDLAGHDLETDGFDVAADAHLTVTDSGGGGSLSAISTDATPAFDAAAPTSALTLDAVTYIGDGSLAPGDWDDVLITPDGRLLGTPAAPTDGHLTGTGTIRNNGVIGLPAASVDPGVVVTGRHYRVTFSTDGGTVPPTETVYAPSFDAGYRNLPTSTRAIDRFDGWTRLGSAFGSTTLFTGSSTGAAVPVTLTAIWTLGSASIGSDLSTTSTVPVTVTPTLTHGGNASIGTSVTDWQFTAPSQVTVSPDAGAGTVALSAAIAGTYTVSGSYTTGGSTYTDTMQLTVTPGPVAGLELRYTGQAREGGTIAVYGTSVDAAGNEIADVTNELTLSSSVPDDKIVGNTVTFPHASPHVITATWNGTQYSANMLVWVSAANGLANTGPWLPTISLLAYSLIALAVGIALLAPRTARAR